jgi:hypothetical protein
VIDKEHPANKTSKNKPQPFMYRSGRLNAIGWSNHYDPVYNMVFIEKKPIEKITEI